MQVRSAVILVVLFLGLILAAGCTGTDPAPADTPTPQVIYVTVTVTPATTTQCYWDSTKMACADHPVTAAPATPSVATQAATIVATTTFAADADLILHRWIRQNATGGGYEFRFYSDGTVVYYEGKIVSVSSNLKIPAPDLTASGTWTKLSNGHYLVKINPVGVSGAPVVREYTIVPASALFPVHLLSDYEQADVDKATKDGTLHSYAEDVFYPELAKTD
jgi:hypothetical protein